MLGLHKGNSGCTDRDTIHLLRCNYEAEWFNEGIVCPLGMNGLQQWLQILDFSAIGRKIKRAKRGAHNEDVSNNEI